MSEYSGINYEEKVDCFSRTQDVKSVFRYGDLNYITEPWLTVFIPTYKRTGLLQEALASVLNQWHTHFMWDIVIVDNEPYDGKRNETEDLIREINNKRILYYRNCENLRPGDNFNRGILLARGEWVMMLHDDDLLVSNTVMNMGKLIEFYSNKAQKPLGVIATNYFQFIYKPEEAEKSRDEVNRINAYLISLPMDYALYKFTQNNVLGTGHIGGNVPSNGTTFNRQAVLDIGGFNEEFGISADLILFYCMANKYSLYQTLQPYGFYRWGVNTMIKPESTYNVIKAGYDFREYAYARTVLSRFVGKIFRNVHYRKFTLDVIREKGNVSREKLRLSDFNDIYSEQPSKFWYLFYRMFFLKLHGLYKKMESKRLAKSKK